MVDSEIEDDFRPGYDLYSLRVRKLGLRVRKPGPKRKSFGDPTVFIQPDVAEMFLDSQSVNEALRVEVKIFILEFH